MTAWSYAFLTRANRDLEHLPKREREAVIRAVQRLAGDPFSPAADVVKLGGRSDQYRLRVGEVRATFVFDRINRRIVILRVLPRGRAYR